MITRAGELDGIAVDEVRLESPGGQSVAIMGFGVAVRDWRVPVAGAAPRPVVLGFDSFAPYPEHSPHFSAVCGRVANRIANAQFTLDGATYAVDPNWRGHTLHGGKPGLSRRVWRLEGSEAGAARFGYHSPDGENGFPGGIDFSATYRFEGEALVLELEGMPDRPTPIALVQHHYFNLGTGSDVLDHHVTVPASAYTELGADLIATGAILPVDGTHYDFRAGRTLRDSAGAPVDYDINLVLPTGRDHADPVAMVRGPDGALTLRVWTDRPGLQVYDGVTTKVAVPGHDGRRYGQYSGLCLEDQVFPGGLAHPHFPSLIATPDRPYRHRCAIAISVD